MKVEMKGMLDGVEVREVVEVEEEWIVEGMENSGRERDEMIGELVFSILSEEGWEEIERV